MSILAPAQYVRLHEKNLDDAKKAIESIAAAISLNIDEAWADYIKARETFEKEVAAKLRQARRDELSKKFDMTPVERLSDMLKEVREGLDLGLNIRVSVETVKVMDSETGEVSEVQMVMSRWLVAAQAAAPARAAKAGDAPIVARTRTSYNFFDNGQPIGTPLSQHLKNNYPESVAWTTLLEYSKKDNKSKLGAWQAVERDPVLRNQITRVEVTA